MQPKKLNIQELIELLKTDPDAAFDKMGVPRLTPEQAAQAKREYAGMTYEEIRARVKAKVERGQAALDWEKEHGSERKEESF